MSRLPLTTVRELTIYEIADQWSQEVKNPPRSTIERELRIFVINSPRLRNNEGLIDPIPDDVNLPPTSTRLSRQQIEVFCAKQQWSEPRFWFGQENQGPSFPGRPSKMNAIVQELKARAQAGLLSNTLAGQARELKAWVDQQFPAEQVPTARTIENGIRESYRRLMESRN